MSVNTLLALMQQPRFAIGDKVKVDQERAPAEWRGDWKGMELYVVGITPESSPSGGAFSGWDYWLCETPQPPSRGDVMDGWSEDHLEAA